MLLFDLKLASGDSLEITEEQADIIKSAVREEVTTIQVGDMWLRPNAIMSILPSKKNHPKHQAYLNEVSRFGYKKSFQGYLEEIGYREVPAALPAGK